MSLFGNKKRGRAMEAYAREYDMLYMAKDEYGIGRYFKGFKLFGRGGFTGLTDVIINTTDSTAQMQYGCFDYRYVISTGNTTIVLTQTVFFWLDKSAVLPKFYVFPEKWYHKWSEWFGMQDIDLAVYPEFSEKFVLQSKDPDYTKHVFQNDALIRAIKDVPEWSLECEGYYTIMYIPSKQQNPEDISGIFEKGHAINDLLRS